MKKKRRIKILQDLYSFLEHRNDPGLSENLTQLKKVILHYNNTNSIQQIDADVDTLNVESLDAHSDNNAESESVSSKIKEVESSSVKPSEVKLESNSEVVIDGAIVDEALSIESPSPDDKILDPDISENKFNLSTSEELIEDTSKSINLPPTLDNIDKNEIRIKTMKPVKSKIYQARNGQVGVVYSVSLLELGIDDIIVHGFETLESSLEEIGLTYSKKNAEITGIPQRAGDFEFSFLYTLDEPTNTDRLGQPGMMNNRTLKIFINPDPKSLWKNLEPREDSLYSKPHFDFDFQEFGDHKVYGASIRGRSHAHNGTFRDDDFLISIIEKNILFAVVADGAGSAKYSREGSRIACTVCEESLKNNAEKILELEILLSQYEPAQVETLSGLAYEIIGAAVKSSIDKLTEYADEKNHDLKDYSTTLLFTLVFRLKNKYCLMSFGVGDGIGSMVGAEFKPILLTNPDSGEHAGQTRFLTMKDTLESMPQRIKIQFTEKVNNLFLMTDGISDVFFETDSKFEEASCWESLIKEMNSSIDFQSNDLKKVELDFKEWINFFSKGNHDDRTILWIK